MTGFQVRSCTNGEIRGRGLLALLTFLALTLTHFDPCAAEVFLPADDERTTAKKYQIYCESCHFEDKAGQFHVKRGDESIPITEATAEEMINNNPAYLLAGPEELARPRPDDYQERVYFHSRLYKASAHAEVYCVDCHDAFNAIAQPLPHQQYLPPATCQPCHKNEEALWTDGAHGDAVEAKDEDAPNCNECHSDYHTMSLARTTTDVLHPENIVALCGDCHGDEGVLKRHPNLKQDAVATYKDTIHYRGIAAAGLMAANCSSCHGPHKNLPQADDASSISLLNTINTCGECHEKPKMSVWASEHGQQLLAGNMESANCSSCHTGHNEIQVQTAEFKINSIDICGDCHEENLDTYRESYHGKAATLGSIDTAHCYDCHNFHDLYGPGDPLSTVAEANLTQTCAPCHPNADEKWVTFMPHVEFNDPSHPKIYYPWLFMTILLVGTMGFFVLHSILWLIRELAELGKRKKLANPVGPRYQRFTLVHRITHATLFISVIGLAATGLPLRYPTTDWGQWIMANLGGVKVSAVLHRIFAALTIVYAGIHFIYLWKIFLKAKKRPVLKWIFSPNSMIPGWTDVKQFFQHIRYFLFMGPMPKFDRYAYWEKFDYWAVFWGVVIIGATGVVMAFSSFFAQWMPGWMFNVALIIHSDEALLAASFLFAIHFFHVHLRPLKFPMDHVMFSGSVNRAELEEERQLELERLEAEGKLEELKVEAPDPAQIWVNRVTAAVSLLIGLALLACLFYTEIVVRLLG